VILRSSRFAAVALSVACVLPHMRSNSCIFAALVITYLVAIIRINVLLTYRLVKTCFNSAFVAFAVVVVIDVFINRAFFTANIAGLIASVIENVLGFSRKSAAYGVAGLIASVIENVLGFSCKSAAYGVAGVIASVIVNVFGFSRKSAAYGVAGVIASVIENVLGYPCKITALIIARRVAKIVKYMILTRHSNHIAGTKCYQQK